MAKYYKRPDGLYETSRQINGKRVRFRGKTCAEVDRKILEYQDKKEKGRSYSEILDEWIKTREKSVSHSTMCTYSNSLDRIKEYFGATPIRQIKPVDVCRYIWEFEGKGYAKNTVNTELTVLKQSMSYAVLAGDIDISPATEVHKSRGLPSVTRKALTEEQELRVERCRCGMHWLLGLMLLYTGCRRGELLALNWQDIDRQAGLIHINKKLNYSYGNKPRLEYNLKSANGKRDVPLFSALAAVLPREPRLGPIFTDADGNYYTTSHLRSVWAQYCRDAGLSDADGLPLVTPHQFRHSFATLCFEAGVSTKSYAAMIGDTEEVAGKVYAELRARSHKDSADRLDAYLQMRQAEAEAL